MALISALNTFPAEIALVLIEAVETYVPPPGIVGFVTPAKTEDPLFIKSSTTDAPLATVLVITDTQASVAGFGATRIPPKEVVAPEKAPEALKAGNNPMPVTEALERLRLPVMVALVAIKFEARISAIEATDVRSI
jgi:hypothetical protein